jgi:hypothetical protein
VYGIRFWADARALQIGELDGWELASVEGRAEVVDGVLRAHLAGQARVPAGDGGMRDLALGLDIEGGALVGAHLTIENGGVVLIAGGIPVAEVTYGGVGLRTIASPIEGSPDRRVVELAVDGRVVPLVNVYVFDRELSVAQVTGSGTVVPADRAFAVWGEIELMEDDARTFVGGLAGNPNGISVRGRPEQPVQLDFGFPPPFPSFGATDGDLDGWVDLRTGRWQVVYDGEAEVDLPFEKFDGSVSSHLTLNDQHAMWCAVGTMDGAVVARAGAIRWGWPPTFPEVPTPGERCPRAGWRHERPDGLPEAPTGPGEGP